MHLKQYLEDRLEHWQYSSPSHSRSKGQYKYMSLMPVSLIAYPRTPRSPSVASFDWRPLVALESRDTTAETDSMVWMAPMEHQQAKAQMPRTARMVVMEVPLDEDRAALMAVLEAMFISSWTRAVLISS
jgi:hypothetical protein